MSETLYSTIMFSESGTKLLILDGGLVRCECSVNSVYLIYDLGNDTGRSIRQKDIKHPTLVCETNQ